jgi:hypothetical protein
MLDFKVRRKGIGRPRKLERQLNRNRPEGLCLEVDDNNHE